MDFDNYGTVESKAKTNFSLCDMYGITILDTAALR